MQEKNKKPQKPAEDPKVEMNLMFGRQEQFPVKPVEIYNSKDKNTPVDFGKGHSFPKKLMAIYAACPMHAAIVNKKVAFVKGDGLGYADNKKLNIKVNAEETLGSFINKLVTDYIMHGYYGVEIGYRGLKPNAFYHVPAYRIKANSDRTKFWVADAKDGFANPTIFDTWRPEIKDDISKLYVYRNYFSSENNVYTLPEYNGAIESIETDIEIKLFNLNNIRHHFSVSTLITFFMGTNVDENVKRKVLKDLEDAFTGPTGKKLLVDFQSAEKDAKSADVKNLSPGDWDKAYTIIQNAVRDSILHGHAITSPILFGISEPGKLGSSDLVEAYETFMDTYAFPMRNELEESLNLIFQDSPLFKESVHFINRPLFKAKVSEAMKKEVSTLNELRAEAGLPPLTDGRGEKLLSEINKPTPTIQPGASQEPSEFSKKKLIELGEDDYQKVKDFGTVKAELEIIEEGDFIMSQEEMEQVQLRFDNQTDITAYIIENGVQDTTVDDLKKMIKKDLGITLGTGELVDTVNAIGKAGLLDVNIDGKNIKLNPSSQVENPNKVIEVMYAYEKKPEVPGTAVIPTTRPFCRMLIENDRMYTRQEIQTMTTIFGFDVFKFGGGFWHDPTTDEASPSCRHRFRSYKVSRKKQ